jgi:lipopolysaccharide export system protein LptA
MRTAAQQLLIAGTFVLMLAAAGSSWAAGLFDAKGVKTVITGDQMEIMKGGDTVVFSGSSKVKRGDSILNADRLSQDRKTNRVEAFGNINFQTYTQDRELVVGSSMRALYHPEKGTGELWEGRPKIIYHVKSSTAPLQLVADRISFDEKNEQIHAVGKAEIVSSSANACAPDVLFRQKEKMVILTGADPQAELEYLQDDGERAKYHADRITVYTEKKRIIMEGGIKGKMTVRNRETGKL